MHEQPSHEETPDVRVARMPDIDPSPDREAIREQLRKEYCARVARVRECSNATGIPESRIIIAPPVLNRTDFGYRGYIDLTLIGTDDEQERFVVYASETFSETPFFITRISLEHLEELREAYPEMHAFLTRPHEVIPQPSGEIPEIDGLEERMRASIHDQDRKILREHRRSVGEQFVVDVSRRFSVVSFGFSGSLVEDSDRFGIDSDIDIGIVVDLPKNTPRKEVSEYIELYLSRRYADEYNVKIDFQIKFKSDAVDELTRLDPQGKYRDVYKTLFGFELE